MILNIDGIWEVKLTEKKVSYKSNVTLICEGKNVIDTPFILQYII